MRKRDYRDYIQDILDSINDTQGFVKVMDFADFENRDSARFLAKSPSGYCGSLDICAIGI